MAKADYYLCDKCGEKTFYDRVLDYQQDEEGNLRNVGEMTVLCPSCSEKWTTVTVRRIP